MYANGYLHFPFMHTYPDYVQHSRKIGLINHATGILDSYDGLLSVPENGNTIR